MRGAAQIFLAMTFGAACVSAQQVVTLAVVASALPAGTVGQSYSQVLKATGGAPPYVWFPGTNFPPFLALNASTGAISGTPTAAGTYTFAVWVTDATHVNATATLTITVVDAPLSMTTVSPIFGGTVGTPYLQSFQAAGGTAPYRWSITAGSVAPLVLNGDTGDLAGTPDKVGTLAFTIQVKDQAGATVSRSFSLVVSPPAMTLVSGGTLPAGTSGIAYSQRVPLTVTGGTAPYTWSVQGAAAPVPGLTFNAADQTLSGIPTRAGTFNFTIQAADSAGQTATRALSLAVNAGTLSITTARNFADAVLGQPYTAAVAASGGEPPYRWSASGLPAGLTIDPTTGQISGTATSGGPFAIAITVVDAALTNVADRFTLTVKLPTPPGISFSGLPSTASAAQQYAMQVALSAPYPVAITGQAVLAFAADTGPGDRTIQFASGGTTSTFTIPAGSTTATAAVPLAVQTGTVAGTITVSLSLAAGGVDITPSATPVLSMRVERGAPVIRGVQVTRSSSGVTLAISGYSTAREVTQATFAFKAAPGQTLQTSASSLSTAVDGLFGPWFQDAANSQFGSQFIYTQAFTVQGDPTAVLPDTVTLTNRVGTVTFTVGQ